jgi:hypothetical protein
VLPTNSVNQSIRQAVSGYSTQQGRAPLGRSSLGGLGVVLVLVGAWMNWVLTNNDPEWIVGIALMVAGVPLAVYGIVQVRRQRAEVRATIARIDAEQRFPVEGSPITRSSRARPGPNPEHAARRLRARCPGARRRRRWTGHTR